MGDAQAVLPHVLDMLGPGIDERHVFAGLHHMGTGIAADRPGTDDSYLPAHAFLSVLLAAEASAPDGLIANAETHRTGALLRCIRPIATRPGEARGGLPGSRLPLRYFRNTSGKNQPQDRANRRTRGGIGR